MNSSIIWIFIPLILGFVLWFFPNDRIRAIFGISISITLALLAWLIPIETPLNIGDLSLKISSTQTILGRQLILNSIDQPLLAFIYFSLCFWYLGSIIARSSTKLISYGLIITSLLISALAVEPFLYASLLIETAVLVSIPLLKPLNGIPGRGLLRFLAFQTISMPFLLTSGWLLSGYTAIPGELALAGQATIFLGLGFVFLLAIFPFNTWIPLLSDETDPSQFAFILWIFPTIGLLFGLYFLDSYSWIRDSSYLPVVLRTSGMISIVIGGIWSAFQNNLKRMLAYSMIMETGFSLLALSIKGAIGLNLFFGLLIPLTMVLFLWASAITILSGKGSSTQFSLVKGLGRKYPLAASIIALAHLSFVGLPLLAGFPVHQALWEKIGSISNLTSIWLLLATMGQLAGSLRVLAVLVAPSDGDISPPHENWPQRIYLSIGILLLILLGVFPQWIYFLLSRLPGMFIHLTR